MRAARGVKIPETWTWTGAEREGATNLEKLERSRAAERSWAAKLRKAMRALGEDMEEVGLKYGITREQVRRVFAKEYVCEF